MGDRTDRAAAAKADTGLVRKNFQDSPSHRIFGHIHEALNKDKNKN